MKLKNMKKISVFFLAIFLIIPIAAFVALNSNAEVVTLEEKVYQEGYTRSILDLIEVKQAGTGTDIDGDATNGGAADLEQMRNHYVGKADAFYRTQGVKYEYDATASKYYVSANQNCDAGITKAGGTLTVLEKYDDGVNGKKVVNKVAENAFTQSTTVRTVVLPTDNIEFKLLANNFTSENQDVDICATGNWEPIVETSTNTGLSGKIYQKEGTKGTTGGDCATWKYDDAGNIEKAQYQHTFGEDDVCTNADCKKQSVDGVTVENNYFPARQAKTVEVEKVASYSGKDEKTGETVTETNVVKITTTGATADFAIMLPEKVQNTLTVRVLVDSSPATHIRFRTVKTGGGEDNASSSKDVNIAAGSALDETKLGVWYEYQVNYSDVSEAYKDQLNMLVITSGGTGSEQHVFYVAYAIDTDKISEKLAADLTTGYVADFDSSLYRLLIEDGKTSNTVQTTWLESYQGEKGVLKVKVTGGGYAKDFLLNLPQSHSGKYTMRMYVGASTNVAQIGTYTSEGTWSDAFFATSYAYEKDKWHTITIDDSNAGFGGSKIGLQGYDSQYDTFEVYIAYIVETDQIPNALAAELPADYYVADFDSALYEGLIAENAHNNNLQTTWLSSFEGEEGVMKVELSGSNNAKDFVITLPKSHSGNYTLRMYISSNSDVAQIGSCSSGAGWAHAFFADGYETNKWLSVRVNDLGTNANYNNAKIGIMGYGSGSTKFEVYLSWVIDGYNNNGADLNYYHITAAEATWRSNVLSATKTTLQSNLSDGYLADFNSADYEALVFGSSDYVRDPKSITATYEESYLDSHDGVLKVEVVGDTTGDFLVELPKSITQDAIKLRYAVVYEGGSKGADDCLRFKYPDRTGVVGMYDTDGNIADLIGDGQWHEIEVQWGSSVKDYLEFQMSTDTNPETVTIYFDEVTEAIP